MKIIISIMIMLYQSEDLHQEFFDKNGIALLVYFLNNQNTFLIYISCKCLVLLSRYEKNLVKLNFIINFD